MDHEKVVLDGDDMRRTLVRIAHEIVERNDGAGGRRRIVGIHRRGAILARRLHALLVRPARARRPARATSTSPSTATTSAAAPEQPVVHAIAHRLPARRHDRRARRRRALHRPHRARRDRGAVRLRPPRRVQLAVLADRGHRELPIRPDYVGKNLPTSRAERVNVRVEELDGVDEVTHRRRTPR